jgi:lipopolysaccharide export system permease protein
MPGPIVSRRSKHRHALSAPQANASMRIPWLFPTRLIVDRYVLWLFVEMLVISFVGLFGLFVVAHLMANFQEFSSYGRTTRGGILAVVLDYYHPRAHVFFDVAGGLLAMMGAIFAATTMLRYNELTALMAAGISPARVIRPLWMAAIGVALCGIVNRELLLPLVRDKLARNAQDWLGETAKTCRPMWDLQTNILITGKHTFARDKRIEAPVFSQLPQELRAWGRQIAAANAYYQPAADGRPAGYLLRGVRSPTNLMELDSAALDGRTVLFSPKDQPWLKPDECFVASGITFEQLTVGNQWQEYMSTAELIAGLHNRSLDYGSYVRVTLHRRLVQPLLNVTLLFLGLPLVLARRQQNVLVAGGYGALLVSAFFAVTLTSHSLGTNYLLPAHLAAWLPVMIFAPLAYVLSRQIWE